MPTQKESPHGPHIKDIALLILTVEGLQHIDGGVGRYLWNILDEAPAIRREWLKRNVVLSFYAAEPICDPALPVYRPGLFERMDAALRIAGGRALRLVNISCGDNSFRDPLARDPKNYLTTSTSAAQVAIELAQHHDALVVISGLTIFAQTPMLIRKQADFVGAKIKCVHMTHSPVATSSDVERDAKAQANEALGQLARVDPLVKIGFESDYMRRSYRERYDIPDEAFVFARSGIPVNHEKFASIPNETIVKILEEKNIPMNKPLVMSWGRSDQCKGFDILLKAVRLLDAQIVPVILNSTYNAELHQLKSDLGSEAVLLHDQPFRVISAILQWPATRVAAFLSQNEPAAVTPAEAMLAAHAKGCVVLGVPTGCFPEMIIQGQNGFLVSARTPEAVAEGIQEILRLSDAEAKRIGTEAILYAKTNHDFSTNFRRTIELILTDDFIGGTQQ
jgi:glycosyltransferase involved in cell wall biosynthesis